jgi:molecular chaperone DnaK (HSP70)
VTLPAPASAPCLGLDFGTSNSVAAVWLDGRVQPVIFEDGSAVQRTLFFLPDDDSLDGGPPS